MKKREKLLEQSMYDLLIKINTGIIAGYDCIMDVIDESPDSVAKRCGNNGANCEKCLQSWMNEDLF